MTAPNRLAVMLEPGITGTVADLGGKGAALAELVDAGFTIPVGGVVTAGAYRRAVEAAGIAEYVADLGRRDPPDAEIDETFRTCALPPEIAAAIEDLAARVADGGRLAVRSSATAEDLGAASFAGQYRSFLDVAVPDVVEKVALTWASLWHRAPRSYRRFRSIPEDDLAMAVLVMAMVPARLAGVAFTADPAGAAEDLRIEAVTGLGEALVSGAETPDVFVVPRAVAPEELPAPLDDVARSALAIERHLGSPQDVEWAWDGEKVWVVQSRPITTAVAASDQPVDRFDSTLDGESRYTTNGIAEMLPGPLAPLIWDLSSFIVEEAFNRTFDALAAMPADRVDRHAMVSRFRGRAILNLDRLAAVAEALPGGSADELERQYLGEADPQARVRAADPSGGGWRALVHDLRVVAAQRRSLRDAEIVAIAHADMDPLEIDLRDRTDGDLLAYRLRLVDLAARAMAAELGVAASAVAAYRRLELMLLKYLDEATTAGFAQRVTTGAGMSPLLDAAAGVVRGLDPAELEELPDTWEAAAAVLAASGREETVGRFEILLARADSMAVFAGPTWREHPDALWATCRASSSHDPAGAAAVAAAARGELEQLLTSSPGWRRTRWVTAQIIDVRLRLVRRLVRDTRDLIRRRELVKQTVLDIGGRIRDVHLELGRRLVARGHLEEPTDIDLLSAAETGEAMGGGGPSLYEIGRRRRILEQHRLEGALPTVFVGVPHAEPAPIPEGDRLTGWGASPGRFVGTVRVVTAPDHTALARNEVLVARTTDASWSPLFLKAGAIVVEEGGPLSHAAIVARELGVPAVMNIPGVVRRLAACRPNTMLTVDGDAGVIAIHEPEPAEAGPAEAVASGRR